MPRLRVYLRYWLKPKLYRFKTTNPSYVFALGPFRISDWDGTEE